MHSEQDDGPDRRSFTITNEYTTVVVTTVETRSGVRLEISAPRTGNRVLLDAIELESLTWQNPEFFSTLLRGANARPDASDDAP